MENDTVRDALADIYHFILERQRAKAAASATTPAPTSGTTAASEGRESERAE